MSRLSPSTRTNTCFIVEWRPDQPIDADDNDRDFAAPARADVDDPLHPANYDPFNHDKLAALHADADAFNAPPPADAFNAPPPADALAAQGVNGIQQHGEHGERGDQHNADQHDDTYHQIQDFAPNDDNHYDDEHHLAAEEYDKEAELDAEFNASFDHNDRMENNDLHCQDKEAFDDLSVKEKLQ